MLQELRFQLSTAVLTILTVAAVVSAALNFQQQYRFRLPDDGVTWVDRGRGVEAVHISADSNAARAGLRSGDILLKINGVPVEKAIHVTQVLAGIGSWYSADYLIARRGIEVKTKVYIGEAPLDRALLFQYAVAVAYLAIGLFVYFRRGSAQKARHFMVLCLASFIFSAFHYTGKLNNFDKAIYWGNVAAGLFAPTIFLHFCLTFPEPRRWFRSRLRVALLYCPAAFLLALYVGAASGALQVKMPLIELRWLLDRIWLPFLTGTYLAGAIVLSLEHRRAEDPIMRQQMKWLRNGTFFGILPFALFYVLPYTLGLAPNEYMKAAVLSLALIPLTLAWAVVRYRLMDVDIIFQRGYAYTLATLAVLSAFYGIVFAMGSLLHNNVKDLGNTGLITIMLLTAFLFQPIRNWIQERLDKFFYRDRYDYRRTLIEFAREMSSETDLHRMLASIGERLMQTLSIRHLAFFLESEPGQYRLTLGIGLRDRHGHAMRPGDPLDLSFLNPSPGKPYLFLERTRYRLDAISKHRLDVVADSWPEPVKDTIADLDLNYYLPCAVRGRTIAYLGVSRTETGDYLSSEDVELLVTLSGYVGIAIENANLYRSLQRKVDEYERLKEFSENIVESINVGILAADLDDRVESWNTQMEQLTGVSRAKAVGRRLSELFPADLVQELDRVRGETGIHHIYKFSLHPAAMPARNGNGNGNGLGHDAVRDATLNIAVAPLVSKDLEQIGRLVIFDDVTDRTELEQRLVQADKLSSIGLLAAGVAHEVNTPLAVISTYAQMLAKQVAQDDQKSIILEKIAKQTFRASEIVNSLLNFSRTSTTAFGDVDVNRVVRETASLLDHQFHKAGLQVQLNLENGLPPVHGNAGKLQQVFLNLFLNARDAMQPGGVLEVKSYGDETGARIEVSDTGHGIAPEHIHRIYDPFFTTKGVRKGTGLGLSVTYGIIQEHGGSIEVSSRLGGGTRFSLELPWSKAAVPRKAVNV
jgi:signal transduction histidine kinase